MFVLVRLQIKSAFYKTEVSNHGISFKSKEKSIKTLVNIDQYIFNNIIIENKHFLSKEDKFQVLL